MVHQFLKFILLITLVTASSFVAQKSWAQATPPSGSLTTEEKAELSGTRKQLATIVFAGLAGAILGLSTLSFYGRPQEHLTNIAIGGAFGVIGGAIYTTFKAATNPYETYDMGAQLPNKNEALESLEQIATLEKKSSQPMMSWSWNF